MHASVSWSILFATLTHENLITWAHSWLSQATVWPALSIHPCNSVAILLGNYYIHVSLYSGYYYCEPWPAKWVTSQPNHHDVLAVKWGCIGKEMCCYMHFIYLTTYNSLVMIYFSYDINIRSYNLVTCLYQGGDSGNSLVGFNVRGSTVILDAKRDVSRVH